MRTLLPILFLLGCGSDKADDSDTDIDPTATGTMTASGTMTTSGTTTATGSTPTGTTTGATTSGTTTGTTRPTTSTSTRPTGTTTGTRPTGTTTGTRPTGTTTGTRPTGTTTGTRPTGTTTGSTTGTTTGTSTRPTTPTTRPTTTTTTRPTTCDAITDEALCLADPACSALKGWPDGCGAFVNPGLFAGCVDNALGGFACAQVVTYASDPVSGECWVFPDACVPRGWTVGCQPSYRCDTGP